MDKTTITIDVEALRRDLKEECCGAYFVGGYGGALVEASAIDRASDRDVAAMAQRKGFDLRDYQI